MWIPYDNLMPFLLLEKCLQSLATFIKLKMWHLGISQHFLGERINGLSPQFYEVSSEFESGILGKAISCNANSYILCGQCTKFTRPRKSTQASSQIDWRNFCVDKATCNFFHQFLSRFIERKSILKDTWSKIWLHWYFQRLPMEIH